MEFAPPHIPLMRLCNKITPFFRRGGVIIFDKSGL